MLEEWRCLSNDHSRQTAAGGQHQETARLHCSRAIAAGFCSCAGYLIKYGAVLD